MLPHYSLIWCNTFSLRKEEGAIVCCVKVVDLTFIYSMAVENLFLLCINLNLGENLKGLELSFPFLFLLERV